MGQCPMMPEPGCSAYPNDKNGILTSMTCDGNASGDSFLVPHRPDLAMRSILDPNQVYETILLQAEILSRRAELTYREQGGGDDNSSNVENNSFGALSDEDYAPSNYAPSVFTDGGKSEMTTYSVATRIAGNFDKYSQPKRKYNRPKPPRYDVKPRSNRGRVMETIQDNGSVTSKRKKQKEKTSVNPALIPLTGCMGGEPTPTDKRRFAKEEFYNVLQLKMKLKLADFYQNEYLPMFPSSPTPTGFASRPSPTKPESAPSLSPSTGSSDSSSRDSATREVAFGSGIASSTIRILANDSSFLDLAITGSLGLIDRGTRPRHPSSPSRQKSPSHYLVLIHRRSGVPLAVCALKSHHGPPVVRIYATKSRVIGQRPAASTEQLGLNWIDAPYPLFAWAEFTTEGGEFPMPVRYSLYMASGSDGRFEKEPSYRASHPSTGSPDISMVGKTQTETDFTGCALFSMVSNNDGDDPFLSLSISRGIDPALMICFAAIVDETIEKTMRVNCQLRSSSRRAKRGSRTSTRTTQRSTWN